MNFGDRESVMAPPSTFVGVSVAPGAVRGVEAPTDAEAALENAASQQVAAAAAPVPGGPGPAAAAAAVLEDAQREADAMLASARRAAEKLMSEASALAAQRRAQAERWSRDHVADADDVGTKRLLEAQETARQIVEQARLEARRVRAEPPDDAPPTTTATSENTAAAAATTPRRRKPVVVGAIVVMVVAVLLGSVAIRHFVAEPYVVESRSMEPELHQGDRLLVDKVVYRLADAKRGDIVVLDTADIAGGSSAELGKTIVKRVVGLPGDVVSAQNGRLFIDGSPIDEPWLGDVQTTGFGPVQVPEGALFVLGDERALSVDSRTFGTVPIGAVRGRVEAIIWPPEHVGRV